MIRRLLTIVLFLAFASPCHATTPELRTELAKIAKSVNTLLTDRELKIVAIGQFTGPPNFPTSAGSSFVEVLSDEFQKLGVSVKKRASLGLEGKYSFDEALLEDPANPALKRKALVTKIAVDVVDQLGKSLVSFDFSGSLDAAPANKGKIETKITNEETAIDVFGVPVSYKPDATEAERDAAFRKAIVDPPVSVSGTLISTSSDSPYAVEILVQGQPRAVKLDEGLPFVNISAGETYAVRLINKSPHDAAVRLSIDGLSVFEFSQLRHNEGPQKGQPLYNFYIVPKQSEQLLVGWHKTNESVDSFLVTTYEQSAAGKLGHKANLGTITVQFSAAWPLGSPPPADEAGQKRNGPNATGFGPPIKQVAKEVKRNIGRVRDAVSVRYSK